MPAITQADRTHLQSRLRCGAVKIAAVKVDHGANGIAEIAQQAPVIRRLDRLRRVTISIPGC